MLGSGAPRSDLVKGAMRQESCLVADCTTRHLIQSRHETTFDGWLGGSQAVFKGV